MLDKRAEFLICGYLDGTLRPEEEAELRKRLAVDADVQKAFEQHRALDAVLKSQPPGRTEDDTLTERISAAVESRRTAPGAGAPAAADVVDEALENSIVALVDGSLPEEARKQLDERLASDPAARELLRVHEALDTLLKNAVVVPDVDHDALRRRILNSIDAAETRAAIPIIAFLARRSVRLAAAAALVIAAGVAAWLALRPHDTAPVGQPLITVAVAPPEPAAGAPTVELSIGPSEELVRGQYDYYSTGLVAMPTRIEIDRGPRQAPRSDIPQQ